VYSAISRQTWKPKSSVRIRFAIAQGFFIALVVTLLAFTLYFTAQQRLVSISNQSYKILAENLAASIYTPYATGKKQEVINAVRTVEKQQGVRYVLVIDGSGLVYYDTLSGDISLEGAEFPSDSLSEGAKQGDTAVGKVTRNETSYYNFVAPFTSSQINYSVRLGVDEEAIDGQFNRLAQLFLYMAVFSTILGIIAAYILASRLTKPIIKLTESALAIRAGNLNAYPDIATNDELEQLSREFQNMVEKLKQFYFQEFSQKKQALEAKKRLEEVNERLRQLDRSKSDFLNAASHQLRTPLSVIYWSLSIIMDNAEKYNLTPEQLDLLKESHASTKRMVDLVNELLDISRIEQGRKELNWAKGNVAAVCRQLVQALQLLAEKKGLELSFEQKGDLPDSFLDEKAFYQVVNNFVDNAVKYTPSGYVHVSVERADMTAVVKVADSGIGMTEEEKKRLFTRFSRGDEAAKLFPNGSGLGMFVAQSILRQHGGSIDVESERGRGTTFTITLPLYTKAPDKSEDAAKQEHEATHQLVSGLKDGEVVEAVTVKSPSHHTHGSKK
jgi:signal transduction histidine kinase